MSPSQAGKGSACLTESANHSFRPLWVAERLQRDSLVVKLTELTEDDRIKLTVRELAKLLLQFENPYVQQANSLAKTAQKEAPAGARAVLEANARTIRRGSTLG